MRRIDKNVLIEEVLKLGAAGAGAVSVSEIQFDRGFRALCHANACGNYAKCWMCPPDAGDIDALIAHAKTFETAIVYQTVGHLEDSFDFEGMMEAGKRHNQLAQRISTCFARFAFRNALHLGAGGCHICDVCAKRTGELCRHPQNAMSSLETYGISVIDLATACSIPYHSGQNTVTFFGAFLFTS